MKVQEDQIIKLQLSLTGELWCADGRTNPVRIPDRPGFVRKLSTMESVHVRVIGSRFNSPLIVELYQNCCSPRLTGRLEVASPTLCHTERELQDPSIALFRMRQCLRPSSLGGWHKADELDYPSYAMTAQLDQAGHVTQHIRKLLLTHPVYHDSKFIHTLNEDALTYLLCDIIDPRWFVDLACPERLSKLKRYLGLTPRCMRRVAHGEINNAQTMRCRNVLACWKGDEPGAVDYERPGNFLWRRWQHVGKGWKGDLVATQAFLIYLIRNWQQQLVSKSVQDLQMFVPENLLKPFEVAAFKQHTTERQLV